MKNTIKGLSLVLSLIFSSCTAKEKPFVKEEFKEPVKVKVKEGMEVATFAGGCFWCTEAVFLEIKGVEKVVSGYIGGKTVNPTYKEICTGETGHAEAIQITFNPNEVAYEDLLEIFFGTHDPTTLNRQGADVGTQYRSEIFYHSEAQKTKAENYIQLLEKEKLYDKKIVTKVSSATVFYPAEDYHQNYYNQNSSQGYCQMVIAPKLEKLRKYYKSKLK
ncbi:peptide-methionine (S)-S-oxide reductase MsrA [Flavobacterium aquaticum]|uniref:Peptide methionine sulfoxide reductase MsrA n=2 Tax=Flavobacterium proteolyticum TaxID=2911683 RepID=A0ABR9WT73_9FLAO|nr:peptide-methionine (S)-S-oxide reductase MsrA [Flavobacterium proteolyticum]